MQQDRIAPKAAPQWRRALRDFFYGLTAHVFVHHAREMKRDTEALFLLVTIGHGVGLPVMPPGYVLRLLPYVVPKIASWKRRLARPKGLWEKEELHLHGL
jgi:hypothetical protein